MRPLAPVASHGEGACARALRLLDAYLDGELTVETTQELLEHLDRCARCARESSARQALREALRRVGASGETPDPALAARIRAALERPRRSAARPLLLAALLALAAGLAVPFAGSSGTARALRAARDAQRNCALALAWPAAAPAPAALARDAGPELAPLLPVLARRLPAWDVVAAHRCVQQGETLLHVVLRRRGTASPAPLVSLVVVPGARAEALGVRRSGDFTMVAEAGRRGTAFVVTAGGRAEAEALGRAALPVLRRATA